MIPREPLTHAEEAAAFDKLINDPRKVVKAHSEPLKWFCTGCGREDLSPLMGCPNCDGRLAPDFMRL
jgi:rubrerythrin